MAGGDRTDGMGENTRKNRKQPKMACLASVRPVKVYVSDGCFDAVANV
jgi:hypothetical protein